MSDPPRSVAAGSSRTKGRPVRYRITYRAETHLLEEVVDADSVSSEGQAHLVLRGTALVMGQPREYVVRRLRRCDVASIHQLAVAGEGDDVIA